MRKQFKSLILIFFLAFCSAGAQSQTVYKTPSGKKYHRATCHMVKNVSSSLTVKEATDQGLQPCKICSPVAGEKVSSLKIVQGKSITVRCKGAAKAGTRCQHMTSIGNGYCYQHQPG